MSERRKTTQEVLDGITRERARLDAAVRSLGKGASTTHVTAEGWTAKDVLSHLIHWASQIAFGLGAKLEPPSYVVNAENRPTGHDEWNARAAAYYRDWPFEKVKAEFDHVVDALVERIHKRSDDRMNAIDQIPWAGARPLWQQIEGETTEHWLHHTDDIVRAARGAA